MKILKYLAFVIICLLLFTIFRSKSENYKNAILDKKDNTMILKLYGKRKLMAHDPISLLIGRTYEDSLLLILPDSFSSIINGKNIIVPEGYYKYLGKIEFEGTECKINLFYDNFDDKKIENCSWNGTYNLVK